MFKSIVKTTQLSVIQVFNNCMYSFIIKKIKNQKFKKAKKIKKIKNQYMKSKKKKEVKIKKQKKEQEKRKKGKNVLLIRNLRCLIFKNSITCVSNVLIRKLF